MKPRSKFISKIYFLFSSKLDGRKLGFYTLLDFSVELPVLALVVV